MGRITDLIAGIKSEVQTALGVTYGAAEFQYEIGRASRDVAIRTYSVLPLESSEVDSVLRFVTMDHTFQVNLIDNFIPDEMGDSDRVSVTNTLYDTMFDVYNQIVSSKAGVPSEVMLVSGLDVSEPEYIEDKDFVIIRMNFVVRHRAAL